MNYAGKQVLVLGLGESGLAMALWLARCGATVRVADTREAPQRLVALREALHAVDFRSGEFSIDLLSQIDFVAVSPGLSPRRELAEIMPAAAVQGIPVWGEIELFAQALAALRAQTGYQPKVIAITGTNGKTTVTSLTGLLCERAGQRVKIAGNISPSALDVLRTALDTQDLPQVWVLELSSFQLHTTHSLCADVATVLNISQDHLDWHGDMAEYVADKSRIFGANTTHVLNRDDTVVMGLASPLAPLLTFGSDAPNTPESFGLCRDNGMQWLSVAVAVDTEKRRTKKSASEPVDITINRLMPVDALKIRGQHNALNALATLALCRAIGLPLAPLLHGLRDYQGEPHRVELVMRINEVAYFDDSKGTNVGATVAALQGLGKQQASADARLVLIAGGLGKGQDFSALVAPVAQYVRAVILIGQDAVALRDALAPAAVLMVDCASMQLAVNEAATRALPGDSILLSPACASFDMFDSYVHRAQVYVAAVRELALSRGEVVL